jgi:hypothetical protein
MAGYVKYFLLITLAVIVMTCVEPFTPSLEKYEDVLVIDGLVTNARGPYTVKLSRSFRYNDPFGSPESYAYILLMDNQGNTTGFTEESPGIYISDNPDFQGVPGRSYKLYVNTLSNEEYESEYVELKAVPGIENLYAQLEERPVTGGMETGFQIYVDSYDPQKNTRYYRYEYEETWEFNVPYPSLYHYQVGKLIPRTEQVFRCWKDSRSTSIMTFTTDKLEKDVVEAFPICFVPTSTNKLRVRYSILVKQYSLTGEAFQFWEQMKSANQNTGTLFDPQPMQINGNIYSLHDTETPVLGFFEASAISEKRIFLSRSDLPPGLPVTDQFDYCQYYYTVVEPFRIEKYVNNGYCVVGQDATETIFFGYGVIAFHDCCDCTQTGTNIEPDFWK